MSLKNSENRETRKALAKAKARQVLAALGLERPTDIPIEDIAYSRGVLVYEETLDAGEAWLARSSNGRRGIIRVRNDIDELGRKRFAVAHELGHWELHREKTQVDVFKNTDLAKAYKSSPMEKEANIFASELLMPEKLFRRLVQGLEPSWQSVGGLADAFDTTTTATAFRLVDLSDERCALVVSKNKRVAWFRAPEGSGIWLQPGLPLDTNTYAFDCSCGEPVPATMQEVPATAWFPNSASDEVIRESSFLMERYGAVLTLLWM